MFGDGTSSGTSVKINDPANGNQITFPFEDLMRRFEEVTTTPGNLRVQVVHF